MATLLTTIARVRAVLMDGASTQIWTDAALTEAVRLALGEYSLAGAAPATLEGLDGALVTSLPAEHESMLVLGGAAYAAQSRAVDRAENFQIGSEGAQLKSWADARLKEYKAMLGVVFPGYLVVLAGSADGGTDPLISAAQAALMNAQAALATAQAEAATGEEARAAAAALQEAADRAAEAARLAELRSAAGPAWGGWVETTGIEYPEDYDRS